MQSSHPHDPSRFEVYTELPDGTGFTIKGSSYVFKFDRFGGWFDEYGNYYNADGNPEDPPSESDHEEEQYSRSEGASDNSEDEFQREFGRPKDYDSDQQQHHHDIHYVKIASNISNLNSYPVGKPFRINFRNMPYLSKRQQTLKSYQSKIKGILNVIFLENEKKQFNGNGYFVLEDYASGESLVKMEGEKYEGRQVYFSVPDVEQLIQDPVENEEIYPDFHSKSNKKYISKGPKPKEEQKPNSITTKIQHQIEVKPPKIQEKKEDPESFKCYKFLKTSFPKKSSFKEWITENKFNHEQVIEKVEKIVGNQSYALVTMKLKVFNKLNGSFYDGNKIEFEPQQ